MRVNLVKDNILKALIVFAMPILISNIFQQLYNTMDTMIIGNILEINPCCYRCMCSSL